jgi:hypothetical protein
VRQRFILLFARMGCAIAVAISLGLFAATMPTYIAYLYRPCAPASCIYGQLPVSSDQGLRGLGISLSTYVVLSVTLIIINGLLCTAVAILLLWRKSDSWIAVVIAFLLYRYRRVSTPIERQQTKWVIFGFSGEHDHRTFLDSVTVAPGACRLHACNRSTIPALEAASPAGHRPPLLPPQVRRSPHTGSLQRYAAPGGRPGRTA